MIFLWSWNNYKRINFSRNPLHTPRNSVQDFLKLQVPLSFRLFQKRQHQKSPCSFFFIRKTNLSHKLLRKIKHDFFQVRQFLQAFLQTDNSFIINFLTASIILSFKKLRNPYFSILTLSSSRDSSCFKALPKPCNPLLEILIQLFSIKGMNLKLSLLIKVQINLT